MSEAASEQGPAAAAPRSDRTSLLGLVALFSRLGATSFGGPAAHVAMMEDEVVRRRAWLTREEFLDLLGATNLIPGPNSTEMAIHVGRRRAGWRGLLVAGLGFVLPATALTWAFAWAYVQYGQMPQAAGLLYGVKPVIIAVVAQALWGLGRTALKSGALIAAGVACVTLGAAGVHELALLFGTGLAVAVLRGLARQRAALTAVLPPLSAAGLSAVAGAQPFQVSMLFLVFLKIGAVLFGSGYVLLAFLRAELVGRLGWLTEAQLLDAVAVGQVTPGPVFTTATFVGYVLGGNLGAVAATTGIFLPAFLFVAASGPLVPRLRRSPAAGAFLDGVNVASLALMAVVAWQLGRAALVDVPTALLATVAAVLLFRYRVNSSWLVAGGALAGLLLKTLAEAF
ncbi:MAG TPA: chromate efflux transporter [Vicinamibacteria bacterium]|nr:chromate efflux transporter [Vicinamibacteria bacterium]